jgi:hypothetical protein
MGLGAIPFATRQKIGRWGEDTFVAHFARHPEYGITVLPYGDAYSGARRKASSEPDAVARPDLLLIGKADYEQLQNKGIPFPILDLRKLPDDDPQLRRIVEAAVVAVEVKFSHRQWRKNTVNFVVDEKRKADYKAWCSRTTGPGEVVVWLTTDKGYMTPMERIINEGKPIERTYEAFGKQGRKKMTWNLLVETGEPFATVLGYEVNTTLKPSLYFSKSGSIQLDMNDDLGDFGEVNLPGLLKMAREVRRQPRP